MRCIHGGGLNFIACRDSEFFVIFVIIVYLVDPQTVHHKSLFSFVLQPYDFAIVL